MSQAIPASDRIVSRNHNAPPRPRRQPQAQAVAKDKRALYSKTVRIVSLCLDQNPALVTKTRQSEKIRLTRMLVSWFIGGCDGENEALLTQIEVASLTGMDRGTIGDDRAKVSQWRGENTMFRELTDMIADGLDALTGVIKFADDLFYEMSESVKAEREAAKRTRDALAGIRAANEMLARPFQGAMA